MAMILVVEERPETLRQIRHMLGRDGHRLLEAASGNEAFQVARHSPEAIDLLITDITLPDMTGRLLARRLEEIWPRINALFLSSVPLDILHEQGIRLSETVFLSKPFAGEDLLEKINRILS